MNDAYKRGYALIDWSVPIPKAETKPRSGNARGAFACPSIASDTMDEPVRSMADGNFYTSKAALRATYLPEGNPQGVRYTEVGNEKPDVKPMQGDREGVRQAIKKAKAQAGL